MKANKLLPKRTKFRISRRQVLIRAMLINQKVLRIQIKLKINHKGRIRERLKINISNIKEAHKTPTILTITVVTTTETGTTTHSNSRTEEVTKTTTCKVATNSNLTTITQVVTNNSNRNTVVIHSLNLLHTILLNSSRTIINIVQLHFNSINMVGIVISRAIITISSSTIHLL
jgi:hypothetical protein